MDDRDLYSGLIRLHILHHSVEGPIFGLEMAEELARHGYRISAGTLYPLLHGLEKKGYLRSTAERHGKSFRKIYRATPLGRAQGSEVQGSGVVWRTHRGRVICGIERDNFRESLWRGI